MQHDNKKQPPSPEWTLTASSIMMLLTVATGTQADDRILFAAGREAGHTKVAPTFASVVIVCCGIIRISLWYLVTPSRLSCHGLAGKRRHAQYFTL